MLNEIQQDAGERMNKTIDSLENAFSKIRAGRAHTDTGAVLRAIEIDADIVFKATKVDGVYTDDPMKNPDATRYETLGFDEAIEKNLQIMDTAAFALCREHDLDICVFSMLENTDTLSDILKGASLGTIVS